MDRIVSVWARRLEIIHSKSIKNAACRKCLFTPLPGLALHSLQCVIARALRARGKAGRCGHRALRNSIAIRCVGAGFYPARPCQVIRIFVGADASVRPPMLYRTSCKRCHCETSSQTGRGERAERCQWQKKRGERVAAVKISSVRRKAAQKFWAPQQGHPPPVPSAPLPKGGWHGKAVTGGFYAGTFLSNLP